MSAQWDTVLGDALDMPETGPHWVSVRGRGVAYLLDADTGRVGGTLDISNFTPAVRPAMAMAAAAEGRLVFPDRSRGDSALNLSANFGESNGERLAERFNAFVAASSSSSNFLFLVLAARAAAAAAAAAALDVSGDSSGFLAAPAAAAAISCCRPALWVRAACSWANCIAYNCGLRDMRAGFSRGVLSIEARGSPGVDAPAASGFGEDELAAILRNKEKDVQF